MTKPNEEDFIGLDLKQVAELCKTHHMVYRVTQKDSIPAVVTRGLVSNRINLKIEDNVIVDAKYG